VWEGTFEELRCCLFFEQRRWRHYGYDPEGKDLAAIVALHSEICTRWQPELRQSKEEAVDHFLDDDDGFRSWTSRNPGGYVLNQRAPGDFMLHKGSCMHLANERDNIQLSAKEKWCSVDKRDLIQHCFTQTGHPPVRCRTCNPQ